MVYFREMPRGAGCISLCL